MLSPRLQAIASMVRPGRRLIDVGTDHAMLPIELVRQGKIETALACDIGQGPLSRAKAHVLAAGLKEDIGLHQGDGLQGLTVETDDQIVIAGLGGLEMSRMLEECPPGKATILLQPMKSAFELRRFLGRHGYAFLAETLVREQKRFYVVSAVEKSEAATQLCDLAAWLGPIVLQDKPKGFWDYARARAEQLEKQSRRQPFLRRPLQELRSLLCTAKEDDHE